MGGATSRFSCFMVAKCMEGKTRLRCFFVALAFTPSSSFPSLLSVGGSMATSVGKRRSVYWGRTVVKTEPILSERARTTRETILSASSESGYTLTTRLQIAAFEYLHSCFSCVNCLFPWFIFTSVTILRLNTTGLSGRTIWLPWTTRNFSRTFSNWWKWVFIITA